MSNIKVVLRFRPQNKREIERGAHEIIEINHDGTNVKIKGEQNHSFQFDKIYGKETSQTEVYEFTAKPTVDQLFKGYNGTIFAYGQTGSGKTHTMQGPSIHDQKLKGLIPRIISAIFEHVENASEKTEFLVQVSYIEIYMEKIRDLLGENKMDLKLRENKDKSIYIEEVTEVYVGSEDDVMRVMDEGASNRKVAATNMNDTSSRSHSIFILTLTQKSLVGGGTTKGRLYLVDLAGSEKVGKTGATGQTLDEAKGINKSLSALGNVINALTEGNAKHVPYRDSKLTRLLQQSLGGNSRTTLVINCSPSSYNEEETISTLRFGIRAKTIKNNATINKELSAEQLKQLLDAAHKEISILKQEIAVLRNGGQPLTFATNAKGVAVNVEELEDRLRKEMEEKNEAFLKQENLQEQVNEKEIQLSEKLDLVAQLQVELQQSIQTQEQFDKQTAIMNAQIEELRNLNEKLEFEKSELVLSLEAGKESSEENEKQQELVSKELEALKVENERIKGEMEKLEKRREKVNAMENTFLKVSEELRAGLEEDAKRVDMIKQNASGPITDEQINKISTPRIQNGTASVVDDKWRKEVERLEEEKRQWLEEKNKIMSNMRSSSGVPIPRATENNHHRKQEQQPSASNNVNGDHMIGSELDDLDLGLDEERILNEGVVEAGAVNQDVESLEDLEGFEGESPSIGNEVAILAHNHKNKRTSTQNAPTVNGAEHNNSHEETEEAGESMEMEMMRVQMEEQKQMMENMSKQKSMEMEKDRDDKQQKLEAELQDLRQKTAKRLLEFDSLKTSLLRDLQNRCEKVIDLEMLLDEAREQYEQLLKNSSQKSLQKRNLFLEKNLETLTAQNQKTINQNNALRLEKKVSEKKLAARNERIRGLEVLLSTSQEKLTQQQMEHEEEVSKYRKLVEDLQGKLDDKSRESSAEAMGTRSRRTNSFTSQHVKIAKPIRGGGGKRKGTVSGTTNGVSNGRDDEEERENDEEDKELSNGEQSQPQAMFKERRGTSGTVDRRVSGGTSERTGFLGGLFGTRKTDNLSASMGPGNSPNRN